MAASDSPVPGEQRRSDKTTWRPDNGRHDRDLDEEDSGDTGEVPPRRYHEDCPERQAESPVVKIFTEGVI